MFILPPSEDAQDLAFFEVDNEYKSARRIAFVVCITARCGSTAFCDAMTRTGKVGAVEEYFNPRDALAFHRQMGATVGYKDHVEYLYAQYKSESGVFGFKTSFWDFFPFIKSGLFRHEFPQTQFVYVHREDVIAQAVSLYRAKISGLWHRRTDGSVVGTPREEFDMSAYSEVDIATNLQELLIERANWEIFFSACGVEPLRISYENIESDLARSVNACLTHLGLGTVSENAITTSFGKVSDDISREMAQRFRNTWAIKS